MCCTTYVVTCSSEVNVTICIWLAELRSELLTVFLVHYDLGNEEKKRVQFNTFFKVTDMGLGRLKILKDVHVKILKMFMLNY